ncbi:MAG: hypothetical protein MZV70_56835 [Desulfobacterales bacterium]|nr:hypothetical protein [Desulfobacterales bacterium]
MGVEPAPQVLGTPNPAGRGGAPSRRARTSRRSRCRGPASSGRGRRPVQERLRIQPRLLRPLRYPLRSPIRLREPTPGLRPGAGLAAETMQASSAGDTGGAERSDRHTGVYDRAKAGCGKARNRGPVGPRLRAVVRPDSLALAGQRRPRGDGIRRCPLVNRRGPRAVLRPDSLARSQVGD